MKFIVLIILSLFVIGCGNEKELSLALDWYPNSNHAGIYSAIDEGFFDEEGIKLYVYNNNHLVYKVIKILQPIVYCLKFKMNISKLFFNQIKT